jgi:hypothetical protein
MLPYWIELSPADLLHGTAILAMAIMVLGAQFLLPSGRA